MKIQCKIDKFSQLFSIISSFAANKAPRLLMCCVKLEADDKFATMSATDGAVGARGKLPIGDGIIVYEPGEVVLPAALLKRILVESNDDEFSLETDGARAIFKGARSKYYLDLPTDAKKFPTVEPFEEENYFKIPSKELRKLIRRTVFATDLDNTHYDLECVKLIFEPKRALGVATDGRRLPCQTVAIECVGDQEARDDTCITPRSLNLIERVAAVVKAEDALVALKSSQLALIKLGDVEIASTVKIGKFPDWQSIFPHKTDCKRVNFIAGELARAIRQASVVATPDKPGVRFFFNGAGIVNISATGESVGDASVDIPVDYDGEEKRLVLDERFLNDFFKNVDPEEDVAFYFGKDYRTMLETTDGYQYVVMQMAK